jgi:hypothetical protein
LAGRDLEGELYRWFVANDNSRGCALRPLTDANQPPLLPGEPGGGNRRR